MFFRQELTKLLTGFVLQKKKTDYNCKEKHSRNYVEALKNPLRKLYRYDLKNVENNSTA